MEQHPEIEPNDLSHSPKRVLLDLLEDNLYRLLLVLIAFIAAAVATQFLEEVLLEYKLAAASLVIIGIIFILIWIESPREEWLRQRGLRLWLAGTPIAAAAGVLIIGWVLKPPPVDYYLPATLILFDTSDRMTGEFDGGTKHSVAADNIDRHMITIGAENFGLATYGVSDCDSRDPFTKQVSFSYDTSQVRIIKETIFNLEPEGKANLVKAAGSALSELTHFEDPKRIILVVGGLRDECGYELLQLREEVNRLQILVKWDLIGIGFTPQDMEAVEQLPEDVSVHLVENAAELEEVIMSLLFERPIREGLDRLLSFVNNAIDPLNDALSAINNSDHTEAGKYLSEGASMVELGRERYDQLDHIPILDGVEQWVENQLDLLAFEILPHIEVVVVMDQRLGSDLTPEQQQQRNEHITALNAAVIEYNSGTSRLSDEISRVLTTLFSGSAGDGS